MANLTSYTSVKSHLFVKIDIEEYRTDNVSLYANETLTFTDNPDSDTINSIDYTPLGKLLSISETTSEIRPTSDTLTISISGVPTDSVKEIIYSKVKGSPVTVYRRYYNVSTNSVLDTQLYFSGKINTYSIQEEFNVEERFASSIILLECHNSITTLENKIAGRKTNPQSENKFYPNDTAFSRVPALRGRKFNFGAP